VSKDRVARMTAIAEKLASENYDFVFLQEVWTTEDYERIRKRTKDNLPYGHYFYRFKICLHVIYERRESPGLERMNESYIVFFFRSGVIGAGLCILSKFQIKTAFFHQWAVNGYMHKVSMSVEFEACGIMRT
jgi:sphingomyelin phosphodiesterase 2